MQIPPRSPELDALLKRAAHHAMTKGELDAQRESWVVGEMMIEHPEMTRDEALRIYRKAVGE